METFDCRETDCGNHIDVADYAEGDIIEIAGATITVGENNSAEVAIREGYTAFSAAEKSLVVMPVGPDGASVSDNMQAVADNGNPMSFRDAVRNGGIWDYKQQGSEFEAFGNFNYGAAGAQAISPGILFREAGRAQIAAGTSLPEWSEPGSRFGWNSGSGTYGDDPRDTFWIAQGINHAKRYPRSPTTLGAP